MGLLHRKSAREKAEERREAAADRETRFRAERARRAGVRKGYVEGAYGAGVKQGRAKMSRRVESMSKGRLAGIKEGVNKLGLGDFASFINGMDSGIDWAGTGGSSASSRHRKGKGRKRKPAGLLSGLDF